jgi:hypothetical protein
MGREQENHLSDFIESIDDMIARHFAFDAISELRSARACEIKDWAAAERILGQLIRISIAHARSQVAGRKTGTMTFDEAMRLVRRQNAMVTRPAWNIFCCVRRSGDGSITFWRLDNCEGGLSGNGWPYKPTNEDRGATDWMFYQTPDENWVELDF